MGMPKWTSRRIHALDARAKIVGISASLIVAASSLGSSPEVLAVLCILPLLLILLCGGSAVTLAVRFSFAGGFILFALLFALLFPYSREADPHMRSARFFTLVFTTLFGISSFYLLLLSTPIASLIDGLSRLRIPRDVVWTAALGIRYLPLLGEEGRRITRAATARGWKRGSRKLKTAGWISSALFQRAYARSIKTAHALEGRGYGSRRLRLESRPLLPMDWIFLFGYPAAALILRFIV